MLLQSWTIAIMRYSNCALLQSCVIEIMRYSNNVLLQSCANETMDYCECKSPDAKRRAFFQYSMIIVHDCCSILLFLLALEYY